MLDVGWQEMLVIAVVAIIVVGPRELPQLMRTVGRWLGRARRMAREFQSHLEDLGREVELDALRKDIDHFKQPLDPFRIDGGPAEPAAGTAATKPPPPNSE